MPRTLTDEQWNQLQVRMQQLQAKEQIADFVQPLWDNPKLNAQAKRLLKEQYPQLQIPDLDIKDWVAEQFAERDRAASEAQSTAQQQAQQKVWDDQKAATQKRYGLTDEGMKDLENFMYDKKVGDYEVAAAYRVAKDPRPSSGGFDATHWHHEKQPGWEEMAKDPEGYAQNEFMNAIQRDIDNSRG